MQNEKSVKRPRERASVLESDFNILSQKYPKFSIEYEKLRGRCGSLATKATPSFQRELTRALLDHHFGLQLPSLPAENLCPPVPNRWFFCKWISSSLLPMIANAKYFSEPFSYSYIGLDIGTGASAIYPLLMTHGSNDLQMIASEIDSNSVDSARTNIKANNLLGRVDLIHVDPLKHRGGPLLQAVTGCSKLNETKRLDFTMTNPPFYDEIPAARKDGRERTAMTSAESVYTGGEVGWVLDIVQDSFCCHVGWYSTMLSSRASFQALKRILTNFLGPAHVHNTEWTEGTQHRWFIAWTYLRPNIRSPLSRGQKEYTFPVSTSLNEVQKRFETYFRTIPGVSLKVSNEHIETEDVSIISVTESEPKQLTSGSVEEHSELPAQIQKLLIGSGESGQRWLPLEGHFLLDFRLEKVDETTILVKAEAYEHSSYGKSLVQKIIRGDRMRGEITRTSRKWRRLASRSSAGTPQASNSK